ncbi:23S rRNA (pseudouridine(1915)-N(3))-methyltransferase RlmH [Weissella diestrammenae]|uniref:Ribosomal RNA large subunit methyltransferase H n=1 Tax=Weissella diestrammenae TaxID=1162633 RepID=A0A7G9T779_9LACO|nr:23S rRNA (pseudouridine(1915)-N(3))-methyltransferase RlmH [Weissella diestrammenae]MCM0582443.1 23S rRNA (pseudouridine(1915)-N(3))-methyltransferase RlmH [Weissella diestrammenae]QNN75954.1 23S rRNA (pseudouridine(1915)-N(3))-methyltransferase RlmH [Weissella diestrammenae]
MGIKIIAVGKLKEKFLKDGIAEYSKRLTKFTKLSIIEVPDEKAPEQLSESQMLQVMQREGEKILAKIKPRDYVYVLAINGDERQSEELAHELDQLAIQGQSDIVFVIGGSLGTAPEVNQRADTLISFGKFTLPHQLMRLVLTEQIYRAYMINAGSPYHK